MDLVFFDAPDARRQGKRESAGFDSLREEKRCSGLLVKKCPTQLNPTALRQLQSPEMTSDEGRLYERSFSVGRNPCQATRKHISDNRGSWCPSSSDTVVRPVRDKLR